MESLASQVDVFSSVAIDRLLWELTIRQFLD